MALCTQMCRLNADLLLYMCGEWLSIINVALISIYRCLCGLNGSLYSNVSPQCRFIAINVWLMAIYH